MKCWGLGVFAISFIFLSTAWPADVALNFKDGVASIPNLKNWQLGRDLFGIPFVYFSPRENGERSNLSIISTGVEMEINLSEMGKGDGYKKLKKSWAEEVNAKVGDFLPYKKWKNAQGHAVHEIGFEYAFQDKKYVEESYYVDCRGRLIFAKSLRLKANQEHQKDFETLLKGLDCSWQ